jgi:sortase A
MDDEVLQKGIGHMEGSSLPVGGISTHSVLAGHTGLPSANLFTDLDQLKTGDYFYIHALDKVLAYKIDQIVTVLPYETQYTQIVEGEDYITLVTCTPYGINSHRLLIRAHRIATVYDRQVKVSADAMQVDNMKVFGIVLAILVVFLLIYWNINGRYRKNITIDRYIINKLPKERRDNDNES